MDGARHASARGERWRIGGLAARRRSAIGRARLLLGISVFWLALSLLFDGLTVLVLPAALAALVPAESQATILGVLTFAGLIAAMLVQPLAGALSDTLRARLGRRGFLAVGVLGIFAGLLLFGAGTTLALVALGYVAVQVSGSWAQAAQQAFLPDLVRREWRGRAAGLKGAMDVGGAFLAFLVLGSLLEQGGRAPALLVIGAVVGTTFLMTLVLVRERGAGEHRAGLDAGSADLRPSSPGQAAVAASRSATVGAALGRAWTSLPRAYRFERHRHPGFGSLVLSRFLFLLGTYAIGRFFLFFVADRLDLDPQAAAIEAGALLASLTLTTAVAAMPAGWAADRFGRSRLMRAAALLSALGAVLLAMPGGATQILLFGALLSLGSAAFSAANWAAISDVVPESAAARYMGIANFGTAGAAAVAGLAGPLVDLANQLRAGVGYPALFVAAAIAFVASALATRGLANGEPG